mgnify:CR=1 FL=1
MEALTYKQQEAVEDQNGCRDEQEVELTDISGTEIDSVVVENLTC